MTDFEKYIHHLVSHCKADVNLSFAISKLIFRAPSEERKNLFVRFLYENRYTPTEESEKLSEEFKEDSIKSLILARIKIDNYVDEIENKGLSEETFYTNLWDFIEKETLNDSYKNGLFIAACAMNKKLPYINKTSIMTMEQQEFLNETEKIDPIVLAKLQHITNQKFEQITEDASLYISLIEQGENIKEKAIILSLVLMNFRSKMMPFSLDELESLLDEDE